MVLAVLAVLVTSACGGASRTASPTRTPQASAATSTSPSTPSASPSTSSQARCTAERAIAAMPLRQRLAQLLIVGVGARSKAAAMSVVRGEHVGGLFLAGDATALLRSGGLRKVRAASEIPVMVAVDDEGGRVQRIEALAGSMPSAREMANTMTPRQVYELARRRGEALASYGVTMNFAPLLDVSSQPDNAVIGDRSFSSDPQVVAKYAAAFARGMRAAGILPTFKHFPGQGRATGNSHTGTSTTPPLAGLKQVDLVPYRKLLGGSPQAAVMIGHLDVPGLTKPGVPASLSSAAVHLLRKGIGFNGLIITDDLYAMDAIRNRYGLAEAVRMALSAGVDMALMVSSSQVGSVLDHLEAAVAKGTLSEGRVNDAVAQVLRTKNVDPCELT